MKIILALLFVGGIYFLTRSPKYPSAFETSNLSNLIDTHEARNFSGAILVNLDGDAEKELLIAGSGTNNLLLKWKDGKFRTLVIPELEDKEGVTFAVGACDLDQDGRDEILLLNKAAGSGSLVMKYGADHWSSIPFLDEALRTSLGSGFAATCIDRKGDGKYGFAISHENGILFYLEVVNGKLQNMATEVGFLKAAKGRSILGIPSITGRTNIYIGNEDGANFYFVNSGTGTFQDQAQEHGLLDAEFDARGMSLIDLNSDEFPDLILANHFGPARLFEQNREGIFKDVTPELLKRSYAVNTALVGDFNLDGYEDLYFNSIRGNNNLFVRHEKDWFELNAGELAEKEMFGISSIAADLDHNGSYEILNTHGDGSPFPLTLVTVKPVNPSVRITLRNKSGGFPRGAILRVRTTLRDSLRVANTGSGRFANYDDDFIFALQPKETIISASVLLPSGKKIDYIEPFQKKSDWVTLVSD